MTTQTIPKGWTMKKFGEVAEINPTESLAKGKLTKSVPMDRLVPFTRQIQEFEIKEFNGGMKFRNGDTLLARITPCLENGKTSFVNILDDGEIGFGSTEFIVIREKQKLSDKYFLYYFAISPRFRENAIKAMTGTSGRQRVQVDLLMDSQFLFPPLPEQHAIASVLSSLDNKIELLRKNNKTLENIAQTLFKRWFVEYEFPNEKGKPYKPSGGKMIDSELGEIPEGWRVGRLGDEFKIIMGQSPDGDSYNENGNGMIFFQGRTDFQERFPIARLYTTEPKRIAEKNDVLVSVRAPVGDINVAFEKCCIGRGLGAVRGKHQSYTLYKIKSLKDVFQNFEAEGTVFGSINKHSFAGIAVIIPPVHCIEKYEGIANPIDQKVFNNTSQIQTLTRLRDSLLPKLMKGELRVRGFDQ